MTTRRIRSRLAGTGLARWKRVGADISLLLPSPAAAALTDTPPVLLLLLPRGRHALGPASMNGARQCTGRGGNQVRNDA